MCIGTPGKGDFFVILIGHRLPSDLYNSDLPFLAPYGRMQLFSTRDNFLERPCDVVHGLGAIM